MATITQAQSKLDEAVTSMGNGDWSTAITYLLQAKAMMVGIPDSAYGGENVSLKPENIDSLIADCRKQKGASHKGSKGGLQFLNIQRDQPGDAQ